MQPRQGYLSKEQAKLMLGVDERAIGHMIAYNLLPWPGIQASTEGVLLVFKLEDVEKCLAEHGKGWEPPEEMQGVPLKPAKKYRIDFAALVGLLDIERILSDLGWTAKYKTGTHHYGVCPICGPSRSKPRRLAFSVNVVKQKFYCHRCNAKGNAINLWSGVKGLNLYQSAKELKEIYGV